LRHCLGLIAGWALVSEHRGHLVLGGELPRCQAHHGHHSTHYIQDDIPQLVIDSIRKVVDTVRSSQPGS